MIIVFGEPSLIFDLEYGQLLTPALTCQFTLAAVDLLFDQVSSHDGMTWQASGFVVLNLLPGEVELAATIKLENPALAFSECFALSRARRPSHTLVTDNSRLRDVAAYHGVPTQGFNWLIDQMAHSGRVAASVLRAGMTTLAKTGRRKISHEEIQERYQSWTGKLAIA
jgi:hypothetical protein